VNRIPLAARRIIIRLVIAAAMVILTLEAAGVGPHRSGAAGVLGVFFPVLAVLSGLYYLRSTRGRP
jgi:hypothetical protein